MSGELEAGSEIGRFILEARLGGGSFGAVWRARDAVTGDVVAIKLLTGILAGTDRANIRAEVEVLAATASSQSLHVVRVVGGGVEPVPYIVMEYVEGQDLARIMLDRGILPADETIRIGLGVADALGALNGAGIVHRDVKPANVMLDHDGTVKLADFGIAKIVGFDTITMTGQLPMTMAYAAPEVWDGNATHQSDLYAMGVLLYQCLVGTPPFSGNYGALYKHHTSTPPDLDALPPETPMALREIIRQCLEKDPAARPTDAAACISLLERAAAELTAPPVQEPAHFGPWIRRRPHATQAWAWRCEHETTGETAVIEVHSFQDVTGAAALRAAVNASARLTPFGAERLLGTNRILLRPDETWRDAPAGPFQFWVARDELPPSKPPAEVSVPRLRRAADALLGLIAAAAAEGVAISLAPELVSMQLDGSLHIRRPGLVAGSGEPMAEAMLFLRALPLDEDARRAVNGATDLRDLRSRLPAAPFVADLLGANTVHVGVAHAFDDPGGGGELPPTPATTSGRREPPRGRRNGRLAFFAARPRRYRMMAAAVLAVALASSALGITYATYMRDDGTDKRGGVAGASAKPGDRTAVATATQTTIQPAPPGLSGAGAVEGTRSANHGSEGSGSGVQPANGASSAANGTSSGGASIDSNTGVATGGASGASPTTPVGAQPPPPTNNQPVPADTPLPAPTPSQPLVLGPTVAPISPTDTPVPPTQTPTPITQVVATDSSWQVYDAAWVYPPEKPGRGKPLGGAQELCPSAICPAYWQDNSPAKWIWAPGISASTTGAGNARYWFVQTFVTSGTILEAKYRFGFDDGIRTFIDGHEVSGGQSTGSGPVQQLVVTGLLASGSSHLIEIWGVNKACPGDPSGPTIGACTYGENPAGITAQLIITLRPN